ncbi:MAG: response regulator [Acidimicrobiia bacterium]|nr:response regulator [Acidimicrobiia bacterium]
MSDKPRLLCVDDEPDLLSGLTLNLRKRFAVTTAESGGEALALFDAAGDISPFDVVLSDMRMPEMNGAELLTTLRLRYPDMPRLLLSGQSDLDSALAAINDAKVFRFLTKPCPPETIIESLDEALEQARLRTVERDLLDHTLKGTVSLLTDVLGLVSAGAYSRTMRLKDIVRGLCFALDRPVPWDLDLATMLSQIGVVVLPPGHDDEQVGDIDHRHAELACELLSNVPRMETVVDMIGRQLDPGPCCTGHDPADWSSEDLSREILRVAVLFDRLVANGQTRAEAHKTLKTGGTPPPAFLLDALSRVRPSTETMVEVAATVDQLAAGMELTGDLWLANGSKLARAGTTLTSALIGRIRAFADSVGVTEPVHVLAPSSAATMVARR